MRINHQRKNVRSSFHCKTISIYSSSLCSEIPDATGMKNVVLMLKPSVWNTVQHLKVETNDQVATDEPVVAIPAQAMAVMVVMAIAMARTMVTSAAEYELIKFHMCVRVCVCTFVFISSFLSFKWWSFPPSYITILYTFYSFSLDCRSRTWSLLFFL